MVVEIVQKKRKINCRKCTVVICGAAASDLSCEWIKFFFFVTIDFFILKR